MRLGSIFFILLLAAAYPDLYAQQLSPTVVSSGGSYSSAGGYSISATIGEIAVTTLQSGNYTLTQGFQQPFALGV
ncbi:MAG: hypothetical protein JSV24_02975, partial [Bacteroidales bacterium]